MALLRILFALAACSSPLVVAAPQSPDISAQSSASSAVVNHNTCNGKTYTYQQLAGYGFIASNARDKFGHTLGGYGSAIALDKAWKKTGNGKYAGVLYAN